MNLTEHTGPSTAFLRQSKFGKKKKRPLRSFAELSLEQNTAVTIGTAQLFSVLGVPMPTFMTSYLGASGWKQLQYAFSRQHELSATSRKLLISKFGPLGPALMEAIDTGKSAQLDATSVWEKFVLPMDGPPNAFTSGCRQACTYLGDLERLAMLAPRTTLPSAPTDERRPLLEFDVNARDAWKEVLAPATQKAALPLHSTLQALAKFDVGAGRFLGVEKSYIATLLDGARTPLSHWMRRIQLAFHVPNNRELADELLRRGVLIEPKNGTQHNVTQRTLSSWARGDQLPKVSTVWTILQALPSGEQDRAFTLWVEYLFARGLTFLTQATAALTETEISEDEAQSLLLERYLALFCQVASSP